MSKLKEFEAKVGRDSHSGTVGSDRDSGEGPSERRGQGDSGSETETVAGGQGQWAGTGSERGRRSTRLLPVPSHPLTHLSPGVCLCRCVRPTAPSAPSSPCFPSAPQLHPAPAGGAAASEPEKEKSALADMFYVSQTETAAVGGRDAEGELRRLDDRLGPQSSRSTADCLRVSMPVCVCPSLSCCALAVLRRSLDSAAVDCRLTDWPADRSTD